MSNETILIIDDSREIIKHLSERVLAKSGYQTLSATDGQTGLAAIKQYHPDLIMLDYNLPEMSGIDILQAMAQESIRIPVVLMTGYGSELSAIEAFRLGAKDYLIKPFTTEEVLGTVDRALSEMRLQHDNEALADEVRRLKVEMSRQSQEMDALSRIGKAVTGLLSVERVLQRVLEAATYLTNGQESMIWLPEQDTGRFQGYRSIASTEHDIGRISEFSAEIANTQASHVMAFGQPLRVSEFTGEGIAISNNRVVRAALHVPLKLRGVTMGVLSVVNPTELHSFSKRDEFLLAFLADYAAVALENARVLQAADRALAAGLDELNTLIEITRTITSSLDLKEIVKLSIQQVHDSWHIEAASIWLIDPYTRNLSVLANIGTPEQGLSDITVPFGEGFVGHVAKTGQWIYTNDAPAHDLHFRQVDTQTGFQTQSLLCVPLMFRDEVVGVMQLLNKQDGEFDDLDVERALSIATAVAIAISNARLFEKAEVTKRHQDDFVATVSHDMRAPLTAIQNFATEIAHAGPLNSDQRQFVTEISKASEWMEGLVNSLLELAKVNLKELNAFKPLDLTNVVQESVAQFSPSAEAKTIALQVNLHDQPIVVNGNRHQLNSAVNNLIDNAIKYSPRNSAVSINLEAHSQSVLLTVCDQGSGIERDDIARIFEKFYRGDENEPQNGFGLGLAMVQSVIEAHDGEIWVDSTPGKGSCFTLKLPLSAVGEPEL